MEGEVIAHRGDFLLVRFDEKMAFVTRRGKLLTHPMPIASFLSRGHWRPGKGESNKNRGGYGGVRE